MPHPPRRIRNDNEFILDPSSLEDKNLGEQPEARIAARDDTATGGGGSPATLSSVDTPLR